MASRSGLEIPDMLALQHVRGIPKCSHQAILREVRILRENLLPRCTARRQFEKELDAQSRPADARFAAENLRIGDDQLFSHLESILAWIHAPASCSQSWTIVRFRSRRPWKNMLNSQSRFPIADNGEVCTAVHVSVSEDDGAAREIETVVAAGGRVE